MSRKFPRPGTNMASRANAMMMTLRAKPTEKQMMSRRIQLNGFFSGAPVRTSGPAVPLSGLKKALSAIDPSLLIGAAAGGGPAATGVAAATGVVDFACTGVAAATFAFAVTADDGGTATAGLTLGLAAGFGAGLGWAWPLP